MSPGVASNFYIISISQGKYKLGGIINTFKLIFHSFTGYKNFYYFCDKKLIKSIFVKGDILPGNPRGWREEFQGRDKWLSKSQ